MRLGMPTILAAAALLLPGANGALTSTLVADNRGGDLNATSSGGGLTIILVGNRWPGPALGGGLFLATSGRLASGGTLRATVLHAASGVTRYAGSVTIPEPASLALLGAALIGFSKLLRKRLPRS